MEQHKFFVDRYEIFVHHFFFVISRFWRDYVHYEATIYSLMPKACLKFLELVNILFQMIKIWLKDEIRNSKK